MTVERNGWREACALRRQASRSAVWRSSSPPLRGALVGLALGILTFDVIAGQTQGQFDGTPLRLEKRVEIRATEQGGPDLTAPMVLVTDSTQIYVLDPAAFGVHRFDRRGQWLGTIGAQGDGPGEFRRPTAMGWMSDTLWVADRSLSRLSFFDRAGTFLRSVRFGIVSGPATLMPRRASPGGRIVSVPYVSLQSATDMDSLPVLVLDEDGVVRDTLAWQAVGQVAVSVTAPASDGESIPRTMSVSHPFDRRSLLAHDPHSRWLYLGTWREGADGRSDLELLRVTTESDTAAFVRLPLGRVAISRRELRSYAKRIHGGLPASFRSRVSSGELARAFMGQIERPSETAVNAMVASEDGTVWLRRTRPTATSLTQWAGYDQAGDYVGFLEFPVEYYVMAASGEMLWTVDRDALGLPTIIGWVYQSESRETEGM